MTGSQDGTVASFFVVLAMATIAVIGLVYDGGRVVGTAAQSRETAAAAARVAAQQLSLSEVHAGTAGLDPTAAVDAGEQVLHRAGLDGRIEVAGDTVTVTTTTRQPMRFLPGPARRITVTASATAVSDTLGDSR